MDFLFDVNACVLNAHKVHFKALVSWQDAMMDHPLRTISYIADIGNMVVLMARKKMIRSQSAQENLDAADTHHTNPAQDDQRQYKMICHVFESEDVSGVMFLVSFSEGLSFIDLDWSVLPIRLS